MFKKTILISLLLVLCNLTVLFSGNIRNISISTDTSKAQSDEVDSLFLQNMDKLVELFYVKQALALKFIDSIPQIDTNKTVDSNTTLPDSIYIQRLAHIPSVIDLSYNSKVNSFIRVYTHKKRDKVQIMLGLTNYYFPIFERVLDEVGLPEEFKYLPIIESALNPRAVSRVGASGLWQFMYSTGKLYKLEINSYVDDRLDPVKSSYAAAHFLKDLYEMFGDWTLALAAYNCGPGNVKKAIRRSGGKTNYWDIYYRLPRETRGYVPAFIAAVYTMNYYQEHGIVPIKIDLPLANDTIMINKELHLKQVSTVLNMPIDELRNLNPQYKIDIIPAKKKSYVLKLPVDMITPFIDLEDSIFTFKDSVYFNPANKLRAPKNYSYRASQPKNTAKLYYKVKSGDNLGYISEWYHVGLSDLRYWNNIRHNLIREGQKLVIYVPKSKKSKYSKINTMSFAAKQKMIGKSVSSNKSSKTANTNIDSKHYVYYTVRKGDNLWTIAKKFPGVSDKDIKNLNNIRDARNISVGQKLKIKKK